jgi:hypothetical protein
MSSSELHSLYVFGTISSMLGLTGAVTIPGGDWSHGAGPCRRHRAGAAACYNDTPDERVKQP